MNLKKWMADLSDDTPVFNLNLVGTHDCVTQYVQFRHISRCQNTNIYQQLEMGVRGLDIRVAPKGDRLVMVHGIARAFNTPNRLARPMDMQDVLKHCYDFLSANPTETIIFQFKNDSGKHRELSFDNLYNTYIKNNPDMWYLKETAPTMAQARGKIILLRRCKKYDDRAYPLGTGIDFSAWVEQVTAEPTPLTLNTNSPDGMVFTVQDRYKYKPIPRWQECILPFLNSRGAFNGEFVICYLSTAGGMKGPYNNARYINEQFMRYELNKDYYYGMIYTDFPSPALVQKVIATNF